MPSNVSQVLVNQKAGTAIKAKHSKPAHRDSADAGKTTGRRVNDTQAQLADVGNKYIDSVKSDPNAQQKSGK